MVQLPPPRNGQVLAGTTATPPGLGADLMTDGTALNTSSEGFVNAVLAGARDYLDMDVAFIGEFAAGRRVFRYVHTRSGPSAVRVGAGDDLETTYCQRVVDGRLPGRIEDTEAQPITAALPVTQELSIGAYIGVPVMLSDGSVYGTFCVFAHTPRATLHDRDLAVMRMLAALIAGHLEQQRDEHLLRENQRARVDQVIQRREFHTVYQPIVDLRTDAVVGYEALTRFRDGLPADWFAMAAACDRAAALEIATLQAALVALDSFPARTYLAVNLSPVALCSPEFDAVSAELPLDRLVLELTEQTSANREPELLRRVRELRAAGARIAVDDAGAGHSGLQRILFVAPDIVKLDRELISGIDRDPARQALARAMVSFTDRGEKTLVAEGIETPAERATLLRLGVRFGQGYLLGKPGPLPVALPGVSGANRC